MAARNTRVYPIKGRYLNDVPHVVTLVRTRGDARDLVASGAFTLNPNDPERDMDAPDPEHDEAIVPARTKFLGEGPEAERAPAIVETIEPASGEAPPPAEDDNEGSDEPEGN